MKYRRFGKTELNLSVLTLGGMRFTEEDGPAVTGILRRAIDGGVNHIETARGYGESEKLIGYAFQHGVDRGRIILTTKISPRQTYDDFMQTLDKSLTALGVDYVDILDVHGINTPELLKRATDGKENWRGVRKAMDDGRVRHVGFSTHGPRQVLLDTVNTGAFEAINLHYYYFFQRHQPVVARAAELDMGVFIISPNDKGGMLFDPPARLVELCRPMTPMAMNVRWLLAQPAVHTLSIGSARPEDIDAHLAVADRSGPLTDEEREVFKRLESVWRDGPLGKDYCSQCYECLPCPEKINIPEALRLRNLAVAMGMEGYAKYRYKMFGAADHWYQGAPGDACTRCGDCLPRCPEKLDIPRLLLDLHARAGGEKGKRMWE